MKMQLAFGLMIVAAAPAIGQQKAFEKPYWTERPVIEAIGRGQIEVLPNRGNFSVTFRETAKNAGEAAQRASERAKLAQAAIRAKGGVSTRVKYDVNSNPNYQSYKDKEGNVLYYDSPDRIESYTATIVMNVVVKDVEKAPIARAAALAAKPDDSSALRFSLDRTAEMNRKAFAAAAKDAAERAKLAAQAAGAPLGALLVLQEGQGPCLGEWYTPSGGDDGFYPPPPPPPPPPAPVMAADIVASGQVRGRAVKITDEDIEKLNLASDPDPIPIEARVCALYRAGN